MSHATPSHLKKRVGSYLLGRTIGEGTYAKVKYGQHIETGEAVAVKVLDKEHLLRTGMVEQIKREISILKQVHHPHIVGLREVMSSRDKIYMVMELVTGGELFDRVVAEGPMKEAAARRLFCQLLDALGYCHSQGVFHRDLKPENVLLSSTGEVKLSDFGLGTLPDAERARGLLNTTCGTPNYVAPEVLRRQGYQGGPADIWSLGVVLYIMLAGCLPFDEDDLPSLFDKICKAEYEMPPWISPPAAALLGRMLDVNASSRATIDELWAHPWVRASLARRSAVPSCAPSSPARAREGQEADIFGHSTEEVSVEKEESNGHGPHTRRNMLSPRSSRRLNAFQLINAGLNISAMFEQREDVVVRSTRFTTRAEPDVLVGALEHAAVAVGGRVERKSEDRLRLVVPNPKGTLRVSCEIFEILPGTYIVDLHKASGNTIEFYRWYGDLQQALGSLIARRRTDDNERQRSSEQEPDDPASPVSPRTAASLAAAAQDARGQIGSPQLPAAAAKQQQQQPMRRATAFELLNSTFSIGALFDNGRDGQRSAGHVQFSSRHRQEEILGALERACQELGGQVQRLGGRRMHLTTPAAHGRTVPVAVRLFEVLPGVQVCQLSKEGGSNLEFFRFYGQLASAIQPIMMKKQSHPRAAHAASVLTVTPSMDDATRQAIASLPHGSSSSNSDLSYSSVDQLHPELLPIAVLARLAVGDMIPSAGGSTPQQGPSHESSARRSSEDLLAAAATRLPAVPEQHGAGAGCP